MTGPVMITVVGFEFMPGFDLALPILMSQPEDTPPSIRVVLFEPKGSFALLLLELLLSALIP